MLSIPPNQPSRQDQTVTILRAQLAKAQTRIQSLEARLKWEDELFANPHLSPGHKLTLRATYLTVQRKASPQDEPTKIFIPAIAEKIGLSAKTVGKNLQFLADTGALIREAETGTDQHGQKITRVSIGLTEQLKNPEQIIPAKPRNHGGLREYCPACGSENLLEEKKVICTDCGTVVSSTQKILNPPAPAEGQDDCRQNSGQTRQHNDAIGNAGNDDGTCSDYGNNIDGIHSMHGHCHDDNNNASNINGNQVTPQPADNLTAFLKPKEPEDNLTAGEKPTTPLESEICDLQETAVLLLDIAGEADEHITMNRNPVTAKKYLTVHKPLTLEDMKTHLAGTKTLGGTLQYTDGTTRALCFDADDQTTWQALQDAATLLIAAGYKPILEPSPAGRGGHLWVIFSERVNASAAYKHVCGIAPALKEISEYWPKAGNQKVRLLAGKYTTPVFSKWCHLVDASGKEIQNLISYQTPAQIIPDMPEPEPPTADPSANRDRQVVTIPEPKGVDHYWLQKYGKSNLWFAWTDEQLAAWYNSKTQVYDLLPPERNGNGLATWRGERTASVAYTKDGIGWVDFGAQAQKENGKQDGGDCLELAARIEERPKREIMSEIAKQLLQEARAALESAASAGQEPPAWLIPLITPAGWAHYNKCLQEAESIRGVAGFSIPQEPLYPPPLRPCICCHVVAWAWVGDRYVCSHPGHPKEPDI